MNAIMNLCKSLMLLATLLVLWCSPMASVAAPSSICTPEVLATESTQLEEISIGDDYQQLIEPTAGGVVDNTNTAMQVQPGRTIPLKMRYTKQPLVLKKGAAKQYYTYSWIDWNNDGVFDDATEQVLKHTDTAIPTLDAVVAVASTVTPIPELTIVESKSVNMRTIQTLSTVAPNPCGTVEDGQVVDNTIDLEPEILELDPPCPEVAVALPDSIDRQNTIINVKLGALNQKNTSKKQFVDKSRVRFYPSANTTQTVTIKVKASEHLSNHETTNIAVYQDVNQDGLLSEEEQLFQKTNVPIDSETLVGEVTGEIKWVPSSTNDCDEIVIVSCPTYLPTITPCIDCERGQFIEYNICVDLPPLPCTPEGNNTNSDRVTRLDVQGAALTSNSTAGYVDHAAAPIEVALTNTQPIPIAITEQRTALFSSTDYFFYTYIWIDLDKNGVYENDELQFKNQDEYTLSGEQTVSQSILPLNIRYAVMDGDFGLRVISCYANQAPNPCLHVDYGQVNDYVLRLQNCNQGGQTTVNNRITQFELGNFAYVNPSTTGYVDNNYLLITVPATTTQPLKIIAQRRTLQYNSSFAYHTKAWLDRNGNGNFEDPEEVVFYHAGSYLDDGTQVVTGNMEIPPASDFAGQDDKMTLRIAVSYADHAPTPCENFANGQVHDYTLYMDTVGEPEDTASVTESCWECTSDNTCYTQKSAKIELKQCNQPALTIIQQEACDGTSVFVVEGKDEDNNLVNYLSITTDGKTLIGQVNDKTIAGDVISDYRLFVEEGILTEKLVVALQTTTAWADYVFDEDYQLMSLSEVEAYVKKHKHLPGIPSAEEVVEKGLNMSEMMAMVLGKVEELYLHSINQQKEMEQLKAELESTNARLSALEAMVKTLTK